MFTDFPGNFLRVQNLSLSVRVNRETLIESCSRGSLVLIANHYYVNLDHDQYRLSSLIFIKSHQDKK